MNSPLVAIKRRLAILHNQQGAMLVEFALIVPILLMVLAIVTELGLALHQENLLEKHVTAGAALASHASYPLSAADLLRVSNFVRSGSVDGGDALLDGWAAGGTLSITTQSYNLNGEIVPYVRVDAQVPYIPLLQGLLNFLGFNNFVLSAAHEEVFIS